MNAVDRLISLFGGIRPMQRKLGEKHASLVQGWQETGSIPHYREAQIRAAAEQHGIKLPRQLLAALFPSRDKAAA